MQIEEEMKTLISFNSFFPQTEISNIQNCKNKQTDGRTAFLYVIVIFSLCCNPLPRGNSDKGQLTNFT